MSLERWLGAFTATWSAAKKAADCNREIDNSVSALLLALRGRCPQNQSVVVKDMPIAGFVTRNRAFACDEPGS